MVAEDKTAIVLPKNVVMFKKKDGKSPFDQWYKKHSKSNIGAAVDQALDRVRDGKTVKVKSYGSISAVVLSWPKKIRIYFGIDKDNTVVLLGGDDFKQTEDIINAKNCWGAYLSREEEDAEKK